MPLEDISGGPSTDACHYSALQFSRQRASCMAAALSVAVFYNSLVVVLSISQGDLILIFIDPLFNALLLPPNERKTTLNSSRAVNRSAAFHNGRVTPYASSSIQIRFVAIIFLRVVAIEWSRVGVWSSVGAFRAELVIVTTIARLLFVVVSWSAPWRRSAATRDEFWFTENWPTCWNVKAVTLPTDCADRQLTAE